MATDDRVLPPSARRLALARRAGLVARSEVLVAGAAWAGAAIGLWLAATRARDALAGAMRTATTAADGRTWSAPSSLDVVGAVVGIVAPLLVGACAGAVALHLAQTRSLAIPRRSIAGAPRPGRGLDRRAGDAGVRVTRAVIVAATAIGWLWAHLDDLGVLAELDASLALAGAGALAVSAIAHLAAALLIAGALDLGVAVLRHRADLRMTRTEAADDARAAGIDPRWRPSRRSGSEPDAAAIRTARAVVIGDGVVAVRYHPRLWPRPTIVALGRGIDATRLIELARRHRIPIHHAPLLARALSAARPGEPAPASTHAALAELIAGDGLDP